MIKASLDKDECGLYIKKFHMDRFLNDKLLQNIELYHFEASETVLTEHKKAPYLYFLVEGQLRCAHYNASGILAVVAMMHPFTAIGDIEVINDDLTMTSVVANCSSILLGIPAPLVRKEGLNDPLFLKFISEELVKKIHSSTSLRLSHLIPVKSRLALFILSTPGAGEGNIIILPEKEALASMLCTTYRHLNRVLKELIQEDTIGEGYPGVKIKKIGNLEKLLV